MNVIQKLPYSEEAERIVLGCAIANGEGLEIVLASLQKEDFYFCQHQMIFSVLKEKLLIDAYLFCEELKKRDLLTEVGGASYIVSLVHGVGTSVYLEEYIEQVKRFSALRKIAKKSKKMSDRALSTKENPAALLEDLRSDFRELEQGCTTNFLISSTRERIKKEDLFLDKHKGKEYLGLKTGLIQEFNECFLGLRGLNLLAAAPNTGKTALSIQLGLDAVMTEKDACLIYLSLEMTAEEIFRRMILLLAEVDYRTLVFGRWNEAQEAKIKEAKRALYELDDRVQILEAASSLILDAKTIAAYVETVKAKTGCSRAILIIDYLQVWPMNAEARSLSENEMDKWRIGEMKKLKDAMNSDPIIVISEARKPSVKESAWGGDLSDVMGSVRTTYTPDVVMLMTPLKSKQLQTLWRESKMPSLKSIELEEEGLCIKQFLEKQGIALCKLEVPKARDGMKKFSIILEFHFQRNKFQKLDLEQMRKSLCFPSLSKGASKRSFADYFLEE